MIKSEPDEGLPKLHNPYAGVPYAWQLDETVDAFLARLPPATTDGRPGLDWIYTCNPYVPGQERDLSQQPQLRGCGDEAPLSPEAKLSFFTEGGMDRLHLLRDFIDMCRTRGQGERAINREIIEARNEAVRDILRLAHVLHVRSGKWMLFPEPGNVNEVWEVVTRATINNELGVAAKVAPRDGQSPTKARLICIYTRDFLDKEDISRVLHRLKDLGLVKTSSGQIYYKCGQ